MVTESPGINSHTSMADTRKPVSAAVPINTPTQSPTQSPAQQPTTNSKESVKVNTTAGQHLTTNQTLANQQAKTEKPANTEDDKTSVLSPDELGELLDEINNTMYSMNKSLRFEVNDKTEDLVVRVINTDTDQVIRQYPSEDVLKRKEQFLEGETTGFSVQVD